jgi:hypothetical protein
VDGSGQVEVVDATVAAGRRYGYRLGLRDGSSEVMTEPVWMDVPGSAGLQIAGARPNPASGPFSLSFSLPTAGKATIEIFDLSGRRVVSREVGTLGAGFHVVPFNREATSLKAGAYTVRLTQGGKSVTGKITIL